MSPLVIALIAIVLIGLIVGAWLIMKARRTKELRTRFGPEYQRAVRSEGDAGAAERVLHEREQRVAGLKIVPLNEEQRNRFADSWEREQAHVWRESFNYERPHEALRMRCPGEIYLASERKYEGTPEDLEYPQMCPTASQRQRRDQN